MKRINKRNKDKSSLLWIAFKLTFFMSVLLSSADGFMECHTFSKVRNSKDTEC